MTVKKQVQVNPDWEAKKALERLKIKWGTELVPGLDAKRAEALGMQYTVHQIGYAMRGTSLLPPSLADKRVSARLIRRTAELMLHNSLGYEHVEDEDMEDALAASRSATVVEYVARLEASLPSAELRLSVCRLVAAPTLIFSFTHVELLDLSGNQLTVLPGEVAQLTKLKKLYVNNNELTSLPMELWKLHSSLMYLSAGENPLEPHVRQVYLEGLPVLMAYLNQKYKRRNAPSRPHANQREVPFFPRTEVRHGFEAVQTSRSTALASKGALPFEHYPQTTLPAKQGVFTRAINLNDVRLPDYRPLAPAAPDAAGPDSAMPDTARIRTLTWGIPKELGFKGASMPGATAMRERPRPPRSAPGSEAEAAASPDPEQQRVVGELQQRSWPYGLASIHAAYGTIKSRGMSGP
jgi:hypothetical protein